MLGSGEAARLFVTVDANVGGAVRGISQVHSSVAGLARTPAPVITPRVDTAPAEKAIGGLRSKLAGLSGGGGGGAMAGLVGGIVGGVAMAVTTAGITAVAGAVSGMGAAMLGGATSMEKYTTQFAVLLGSTQAAKDRMAELTEFAKLTPFELPGVVQASKTLEVFSKGAMATGAGLTLVGDIASGTGMEFQEAAMWIGRMYDALQSGRPLGEAAMRLQEVGALSGESRAKIEAYAESVKNGAMTGAAAWALTAGEFSRYNGMMLKMSETMEGKTSNLSDAWGQLMTKAGEAVLPVLKSGVDALITALDILATAAKEIDTLFTVMLGAIRPITDSIIAIVQPVLELVRAASGMKLPGTDSGFMPWDNAGRDFMGAQDADRARAKAALAEAIAGTSVGQQGEMAMSGALTYEKSLYSLLDRVAATVKTKTTETAAFVVGFATKVPIDVAAGLVAGRAAIFSAVGVLIEAYKKPWTDAMAASEAIGILHSAKVAAGLTDGNPAVRDAAQNLMDNALAVLNLSIRAAFDIGTDAGRAYIVGITGQKGRVGGSWGATPKGKADPIDALMKEWKRLNPETAVAAVTAPMKATAEAVAAVKASFVTLKAAMLTIPDFGTSAAYLGAVKAYAGLAAASKLTGDAGAAAMKKVSDAIDKANATAADKIAKMQKALTDLRDSLAAWPAFTATGILAGIEAVSKKLGQAWATLSAQEKMSAIKSAATEVERAAKVATLPPEVQAVYAAIDAATAKMKAAEAAADKAKPGSAEWKKAFDEAVGWAVQIDKLTQLAQDLLAATAAVAQTQANYDAAVAQAAPGYIAPTAVEQSLLDLNAAQEALAALVAAIVAATAQITGATPHAAGGWVGLNGPELVKVGEKGREYIVPNHDLMDWGRVPQGNGGGSFSVNTPLYLDGDRIGQRVDRFLYEYRGGRFRMGKVA